MAYTIIFLKRKGMTGWLIREIHHHISHISTAVSLAGDKPIKKEIPASLFSLNEPCTKSNAIYAPVIVVALLLLVSGDLSLY